MVVEELQRPAFAAVLVRDEIVQSQSLVVSAIRLTNQGQKMASVGLAQNVEHSIQFTDPVVLARFIQQIDLVPGYDTAGISVY